jgi:hypothetical protein
MRDLKQADLPRELADKYQVDRNTLKAEVQDNPKDRIEIELGDSKQDDFKPQYKLMRWDNETNFSIRAKETDDTRNGMPEVNVGKGRVEYVANKYKTVMYDDDEGFNFETELLEKPTTNVLTFTVNIKSLVAYYQPPLTQEEIDQGAERPDNVVGSYAVYHDTKGGMNDADGMEYKVGKAFHLYRMKAVDANGEEVWCDYNTNLQETSVLEVTIPQDFLDQATYPVKVR